MLDDLAVFDDGILVACVMVAMKVVKATRGGAIGNGGSDGSAICGAGPPVSRWPGYKLARLGILILKIQMPFADDSCGVALFLE